MAPRRQGEGGRESRLLVTDLFSNLRRHRAPVIEFRVTSSPDCVDREYLFRICPTFAEMSLRWTAAKWSEIAQRAATRSSVYGAHRRKKLFNIVESNL